MQRSNGGLVDEGAEHDRTHAIGCCGLANVCGAVDGLVDIVDERCAHLSELPFWKLCKQAVAKGFSGNAGTVRDKEDGADGHFTHDGYL